MKLILLIIFSFSVYGYSADRIMLAKGKWYFEKRCSFCHERKGQGSVGPNLTDSHFIYGADKAVISAIVKNGIPAKGMPNWSKILPKDQIDAIIEYVYSIRGTNVKGKQPEGVKIDLKAKK